MLDAAFKSKVISPGVEPTQPMMEVSFKRATISLPIAGMIFLTAWGTSIYDVKFIKAHRAEMIEGGAYTLHLLSKELIQ